MKVKYFVISLPRTGTSSISKMAKICGMSNCHAPSIYFENRLKGDQFNFFSDTPVFCPNFVEKICKTEDIIPKFIYINRNFFDIFDSWKRVGLYNNYQKMKLGNISSLSVYQKFDIDSYNNAFDDVFLNDNNFEVVFQKHKDVIISIIENNKNNLLEYDFSQGWGPFCEYLNVPIPNEHLPILNKNKMFDDI